MENDHSFASAFVSYLTISARLTLKAFTIYRLICANSALNEGGAHRYATLSVGK